MPDTPKWTPGPYSSMGGNIIAATVGHLPYLLASVYAPLPGVEIQGEPEKTAQLLAAAPELYTALSFADVLIETFQRKAKNMHPTLAEAFRQAHMKATAALAKANPERQTDGE